MPRTSNTGLDSSGMEVSQTFVLGGSSYNYTTDPKYAPSNMVQSESGPMCSGILGGSSEPYFYVVGTDRTGGVQRTSTGLRLIDDGNSRLDCWTVSDDGCQIVVPLPVCNELNINLSYSTNILAAITSTPVYAGIRLSLIQTQNLGAPAVPLALLGTGMYMASSTTVLESLVSGTLDITNEAISGINTRFVEISVNGAVNSWSTGQTAEALIYRGTIANPRRHVNSAYPYSLCIGLARNGGALSETWWTELNSLSFNYSL